MYCTKCGTKLEEHTKVCPKCGQKMNKEGFFKNNLFAKLCAAIAVAILVFVIIIMVTNNDKKSSGTNSQTETKATKDAKKDTENEPTKSVKFNEKWYQNYMYFQSENGDTLEMQWLDDGWMFYIVNGSGDFETMDTEYEKQKDGSYLYVSELGGANIFYQPKDNSVKIDFDGESTTYYYDPDAYEEQEESYDSTYYTTDPAPGENYTICVRGAWNTVEEDKYGKQYNVIKVSTDITNTLDFNQTLDTSTFTLDNNGVIATGYSDYDNMQIGSSSAINTVISFRYPLNTGTDMNNMTMTADGIEISLADRPQSDDELNEFYGTYYNGSAKYIVTDNYDGSYNMMYISIPSFTSPTVFYYNNIVLGEDNTFKLRSNGETWTWEPENHCISYVSFISNDDVPTVYSK